jgi:pimeloyl-ACP methyl ester carboxylesterase
MHTIEAYGHTLSWEEHSSGERTLIFIHGYSGNRAIWNREVARFADLGRCVTLDLPGHYPAVPPRAYRTLDQDTLLALELRAIRAIVGAGRATLIGHSTGGLVALAAAALLPAHVERVVAITPVVWGPLTGALGFYQRALRHGGYPLYWLNYWLTQRSLRFIQAGIGLAYSGSARAYVRNPTAAAIVRAWHPTYRRNHIRHFAVLLALLETCDIRPLARQIRRPALVIGGGRDTVVPPAQARWLAEHVPAVRYLEVPDAGHVVHWEAADVVETAVRAWLTGVERAL